MLSKDRLLGFLTQARSRLRHWSIASSNDMQLQARSLGAISDEQSQAER